MKLKILKSEFSGYQPLAFKFICPMCVFKVEWNLDLVYIVSAVAEHCVEFHRIDPGLINLKYKKLKEKL